MSARAIALQIVYIARGTLSAANDARDQRQVVVIQAKLADPRVGEEVPRIDGSDDRRSDLIPVQYRARRNRSNIGVICLCDAAQHSE